MKVQKGQIWMSKKVSGYTVHIIKVIKNECEVIFKIPTKSNLPLKQIKDIVKVEYIINNYTFERKRV